MASEKFREIEKVPLAFFISDELIGGGAIHPFYSPLAPPPNGIKIRLLIIDENRK